MLFQIRQDENENAMIADASFREKRANQRFSFFADAEITLRDGTSVPTQIAELSASGCYMGTLVPIPIGTEFRLRISHDMRTCELKGKVVYVHSGSGLGIFGMGVLIQKIAADERSVIDAWLHDLSRKRLAIPVRSDELPLT
jgi:PilZ domain-containing protein